MRAVLFDLDGVIVDTAKYHYLAWKELADRLGVHFDEQINERLKGVSRMASLEIILERATRAYSDVEKAGFAASKNERYVAMVEQLTPEAILPGVVDFLAALRAAGIRSAVCSASRSAAMIVDLLGLTGMFDLVLGGADVTRPKPDPQIFDVARQRFGLAADECLVVEDAYAGIAAAKVAGMKALGIGDPDILTNADVVYPDMTAFTLTDARALFDDRTHVVVNPQHNPQREHFWETVFTLSNAAMGIRAVEEELTSRSKPGLYVAGIFNRSERLAPEIVNLPDVLPIWLEVAGQKIAPDTCAVTDYRRELDLRNGVLHRSTTFATPVGPCTVASRRFLSFADVNCGGVEYHFTFADYTGPVTVCTHTDLHQPSREGVYAYDESVMHYVLEGFNDAFAENAWARIKLRDRGTLMDFASFTRVTAPLRDRRRKLFYDRCVETLIIDVEAGQRCTATKFFVIADSREVAPEELQQHALTKLERMKHAGFEEELQRSAFALRRRWRDADVVVEGDEPMQRLLRYNIYQLIGLGAEHTSAFGIGAKGLSSEHYGGHYFWDTEVYILPFYLNTNPAVARNLLEFRFRTLDAARSNAAGQGFDGCLWPWQSDELGNESIRQNVTDDGRVIRRDILDQYHLVSDVAYACFAYFHQTFDEFFFREKLAPIVVESLRFWRSLIYKQNAPDAKVFHVRGVMGPDEYHAKVDDNYYTNFLTRYVFESFFSYLDHASPKQRYDVLAWNKLGDDELAELRTIGERIHLPPLRDDVIEQFAGYFKCRDLPITQFSDLGMPSYPDPTVGAGLAVTERQEALLAHATTTQLIKQADATLPLCLLPHRFTPQQVRATFDYYDLRTLQYSSLSPGVCAIVGATAGNVKRAYQLFKLGASMDLADVKQETATGLHTACHGGTYLGAVWGFAGVRATQDYLEINPQLPAHWQRVTLTVRYRGARVKVDVTPDSVRVSPDAAIPVKVRGEAHTVSAATVFSL